MTTVEIQSEIEKLNAECAKYKARLEKIKSATNHVTPEEKEKVYKERDIYVKEWKKRKRMVRQCNIMIKKIASSHILHVFCFSGL